MSADPPKVSVVFATHERAGRLEDLLRSLEAQTLPHDEFEVIAVDDGSRDATGGVLAAAERSSPLLLRTVRRPSAGGPAVARNAGWRLARAPLVAFTDDDCVADPGWLEAGLRGAAGAPGTLLQGRTEPRADELHLKGVFSRTLEVPRLSQHFQTCNVFYPRELLERVGGFDEETFSVPGGEDADLAWRAIEAGAGARFLDDARVSHAVARIGPVGKLRVAWRWTETTKIYARHPELRRRILTHGVFWKRTHYLLARLILALLLPRRLRPLGWWLAYPYLAHLRGRGRVEGGGLLMGPYYLVHDLVELAAMVRGSLRYRTLVI